MSTKPPYDLEQINIMTWLRFPLIMGVVLVHANIYSLVEIWEGVAPQWPGWLIYILNYLCLIVLPARVPLLFIISGYFFFRNNSKIDRTFFINKYRKRVDSLLIPYIAWNTIAIIILYLRFNLIAKEGYTTADYLSGFWDFSQRSGNDPADGPLWYMRDLMVISIFAPLLYQLLKRRATAILYFTIITVCYVTDTGLYVTGFGGGAFMFFPIGAYIAIHKIDITRIPTSMGILTLVLYIPSQLVLNNFDDSAALFLITTFIKTTATFYIVTLLFRKRIIGPTPRLTKICFVLYALHGIIIGPIVKALYTLLNSNNPFILLFIYIIAPAIMVLIAFVIDKLLQTHAPRLGKIITGNRRR